MGCQDRLEELSAYLDGELTGAELEAFREHLRGCAACQKELAEQEAVWDLLGEFKVGETPVGLTERILDRTAR